MIQTCFKHFLHTLSDCLRPRFSHAGNGDSVAFLDGFMNTIGISLLEFSGALENMAFPLKGFQKLFFSASGNRDRYLSGDFRRLNHRCEESA